MMILVLFWFFFSDLRSLLTEVAKPADRSCHFTCFLLHAFLTAEGLWPSRTVPEIPRGSNGVIVVTKSSPATTACFSLNLAVLW